MRLRGPEGCMETEFKARLTHRAKSSALVRSSFPPTLTDHLRLPILIYICLVSGLWHPTVIRCQPSSQISDNTTYANGLIEFKASTDIYEAVPGSNNVKQNLKTKAYPSLQSDQDFLAAWKLLQQYPEGKRLLQSLRSVYKTGNPEMKAESGHSSYLDKIFFVQSEKGINKEFGLGFNRETTMASCWAFPPPKKPKSKTIYDNQAIILFGLERKKNVFRKKYEPQLEKAKVSTTQIKRRLYQFLADTIYHELRHVEAKYVYGQWAFKAKDVPLAYQEENVSTRGEIDWNLDKYLSPSEDIGDERLPTNAPNARAVGLAVFQCQNGWVSPCSRFRSLGPANLLKVKSECPLCKNTEESPTPTAMKFPFIMFPYDKEHNSIIDDPIFRMAWRVYEQNMANSTLCQLKIAHEQTKKIKGLFLFKNGGDKPDPQLKHLIESRRKSLHMYKSPKFEPDETKLSNNKKVETWVFNEGKDRFAVILFNPKPYKDEAGVAWGHPDVQKKMARKIVADIDSILKNKVLTVLINKPGKGNYHLQRIDGVVCTP